MGGKGSKPAVRAWKKMDPSRGAEWRSRQPVDPGFTVEKEETLVNNFRKLESLVSTREVPEARPEGTLVRSHLQPDRHAASREENVTRPLPRSRSPSKKLGDLPRQGCVSLDQLVDIDLAARGIVLDGKSQSSSVSIESLAELYKVDVETLKSVLAHTRAPISMNTSIGKLAVWDWAEYLQELEDELRKKNEPKPAETPTPSLDKK